MNILLIEDDPMSVKLVSAVLSKEGHTVRTVDRAENAFDMIRDQKPEVILSDMILPGIDGLEFARQMQEDSGFREIPLIAITGHPSHYPKSRVLKAGFSAYFLKPFDTRELPGIVERVVRDKDKMKILIVDDKPVNLKLLRAQLEAEGHEVLDASDGLEAMAKLESVRVDLIISDLFMPNLDGYSLCHKIRSDERFKKIPFIVYSSTHVSPGDKQMALECGADAFFVKGGNAQDLLARVQVIKSGGAKMNPPEKKPPHEISRLKQYSELLVRKLEEKNAELQDKVTELQSFIDATVDREERMIKLKKEVNALSKELGRPEPYEIKAEGRS